MKSNKNFFFNGFFSSKVRKLDPEIKTEDLKFVRAKFLRYQELFSKDYLISDMTYNTMHFCLKNGELGNIAGNVGGLIVDLNKFATQIITRVIWNKKFVYGFLLNTILVKKKFYLGLAGILRHVDNFFFKYTYFFQRLIRLGALRLKLEKQERELKKKKLSSKQKSITKEEQRRSVGCFLLVGCTKNNFFVTVIDNKGQTIVSRSGGNSDGTGSKQGGTVFSADNAVYEACYMAKQGGVETLAIHVGSSFRLPQIKHCFEGLETSGLGVEEVVYGPLREFGGCRKKKPGRV